MLTKMRLKAVGTAPATASVSALIRDLPRSPELAAAETDLAEARAEREDLRSEIAMLSGEHIRAPDAERERQIRDLHRQMRDAEARIKAARQRRNEARLPLAGEVARTLTPIIATEAERLLGAVSDIRSAMETLGEAASVSQGFAVAGLDEQAAIDYRAPELAALPYIDQRPLAAIERFARRLRGEMIP